MKLYNLNSFYLVTDIQEHKQNKMKLLSAINSLPHNEIKNNERDEFIHKTDWNLDEDVKRDYYDVFFPMIKPYMNKISEKMMCGRWSIDNYWFQVYGKTGQHTWHLHNKANWANVYFLHLPKNTLATEIYDYTTNTIINDIQVKEGQMLTFPAYMLHRSPKNNSDDLKVIIAFNSNFDDTTLTF